MSIGKNLKVIRSKKNLSQQEIADFVGVDRKTYVSWEAETADVKSVYIPKLAEILHVDINDLFSAKSRDIIINNTENKDNSINGIVFLLTDKDSIDKFVETVKKAF